ncbi:MAG TPA: hypothetical protein VF538_16785 [Pyrinomonadaceae bacterium]|jgi:hypothetical protein
MASPQPQIPANIILGLSKIATLPDEPLQELISALEKYPLALRQGAIFEEVDLHLDFLSPDEEKGVKEAIIPIYKATADGKVSENIYVDSVIQTIKEQGGNGLEWVKSNELVERFRDRLTRLSRIEALRLVIKAHNVLTTHSQAYSSARILSDIRPVFGEGVEDSPKGALIVHMLNLTYYENRKRREFVVALDTKDVDELITVLERARAKTESLKSVIASTKLPYIEVK